MYVLKTRWLAIHFFIGGSIVLLASIVLHIGLILITAIFISNSVDAVVAQQVVDTTWSQFGNLMTGSIVLFALGSVCMLGGVVLEMIDRVRT